MHLVSAGLGMTSKQKVLEGDIGRVSFSTDTPSNFPLKGQVSQKAADDEVSLQGDPHFAPRDPLLACSLHIISVAASKDNKRGGGSRFTRAASQWTSKIE
jgi:hypothetical protein